MGSKSSRVLRRRIDFQKIKEKGRRVYPRPWLMMVSVKNDIGFLRYGFTISAHVGNAVVRNKIKRRMREILRNSFRSTDFKEVGFDVNFVFRSPRPDFYKNLEFLELETAVQSGLRKLA